MTSTTLGRCWRRLCAERGENFACLSRLIGRNDAYIQQYLRKGTPRQLKERERRTLARYFQIPESMLGGMPEDARRRARRAGAGDASAGARVGRPGRDPGGEATRPYFAFDPALAEGADRVAGGEAVADPGRGRFDGADAERRRRHTGRPRRRAERLRDGIYVLRVDGTLLVKRLAIHPVGRRVTVQSDNPAYGDLPDCGLDEIECIGRVIWAGRKIA